MQARTKEKRRLLVNLREWLFSPTSSDRWPAIIRWWEIRRLIFNVLLLALCLIYLMFLLPATLFSEKTTETPWHLVIAVVSVGIVANIYYTGGWIVDIIARLMWREKAANYGPVLWSLGAIFLGIMGLTGPFSFILFAPFWLPCFAVYHFFVWLAQNNGIL